MAFRSQNAQIIQQTMYSTYCSTILPNSLRYNAPNVQCRKVDLITYIIQRSKRSYNLCETFALSLFSTFHERWWALQAKCCTVRAKTEQMQRSLQLWAGSVSLRRFRKVLWQCSCNTKHSQNNIVYSIYGILQYTYDSSMLLHYSNK